MRGYRLHKYKKNTDKNEWTSFTDIGKPEYSLSFEQYLNFENMYIQVISNLININDNDSLIITNFESIPMLAYEVDNLSPIVKKTYIEDYNSEIYKKLYNHIKLFTGSEFNFLMRILLRDEAWYRIIVNSYMIDVGFDYYVHIYTDKELPIHTINSHSLYIEKYNFPFD